MEQYKKVIDSGQRERFVTGSRRDSREGKGRYDLLPFYAIERLAQHYENGARKYGDRNWELGQPLTRYVDSCIRHLSKWMLGYREEDHLAAAGWNILSLIYTEDQISAGKLPYSLLDGLPKTVLNLWKKNKKNAKKDTNSRKKKGLK